MMLTSDLLRVKKSRGAIVPRYLDVDDEVARERAQALVAIFESHQGKARALVDERVEEAIGHGTDFLIWRGLAKLLYDRSEFEVRAQVAPEVVREALFLEAARAGNPHREDARRRILERVGESLGVSPEACEVALYADLEERQVLSAFKTIDAEGLLHRYNLALAQAVLYRALTLKVHLQGQNSGRLRHLFQMLKFHRLMHRTERTGKGYVIEVDGPASVLKGGRRYGLAMAKFLPALLHLKGWTLEAVVDWDNKERTFALGPQDGLQSARRVRGQWLAEEEQWFEERFSEKAPEGWRLERRGQVVDLGDNEVLVTDYVLTGPGGREVLLEIVGTWRASYLRRRLERLAALKSERPVILVVSERLRGDREKLEAGAVGVVFYKGVILVDKVVEAACQALGEGAEVRPG
ncbi:hypothetical protein DL240_04085 [Lujinxingia litoralis]|uniref:DUF790 domain-containing protein n=1 Tax=Lujinxingia litoralis TaxID=2211119 RepID=A0A328CBI2_9DELT|nr:DUF790 family protein [Lujinxingia litoralis]RAL25398.1 hypothetical protein DL240_04085 [Lujinxingia litoralis]